MILAGDIGGTKTVLAIFDATLREVAKKSYPSKDHSGLKQIVDRFLAETGERFEQACFGVAGPVRKGWSRITNLPWVLDASQMAREFGIARVGLINDVEANAHGIPALKPDDFETLQEGERDACGNAALIAAGTGLGEAGLYWDGREHRPFATEGGHTSFSPRNGLEHDLWRHLARRFDPVSWERVLSGPGLHHVYQFMIKVRQHQEPVWLTEEMEEGDPSAAISRAALAGRDPVCVETVDLFVSLYGAEAGNLALTMMATGGVYVGGGVAPKILRKMKEPGFLESFLGKGRMRPLLEAMPVRVIRNPETALLGAARFASRMD